ncbi:PLP-dependent aminotransferase family protein [Notoacmeibacter ruber]|uniref:PLP-dependent aminotransferase family protein n=1 Tax=Notoacmeibacter ruber TaxID=2670375 RepID=A0A3L7JBW2_9HYPH|nr:PLP-dependent aminotransferase family protein [Notoacmeibacter ruber]RLQ88133.1 PLP-dependent aminotransferase family protein [Notoacmeibacter ruber]
MLQPRLASRAKRMRASEIRELLKLLARPDIISFAGGIPDEKLFPAEAAKEGYAKALDEQTRGISLQYSLSDGYVPLREWIVDYMATIGVQCDVENIMITSGSQQALDFIAKLYLSPNDTALVTWPTYLGALQAFNAYEPRFDRLDPMGNRSTAEIVREAEEAGGAVKFAYLSADFSNPTGQTYSREMREKLIEMADEFDMPIIEDGAYQALRFDGKSIPPILAIEQEQRGGDIEACRTIYCGSFSKTLAPGLRIGWVCGARQILDRLVIIKQAGDLHTSTINQIVIDHIARTVFDEQVDKIGSVYSARRDKLLAELKKHMPEGVSWTEPEGGMFVWVTLPKHLDGADLLAKSLETEKVAFVPGQAFFADGSGANTIRLSFSCADDEMIEEGMARLGRLIAGAM